MQAQHTRIQLCGKLVIEIDGQRLEPRLPGGQGRLLFGFLAVNRHRSVDRDELVDVLWPDQPPPGFDTALRAVVSRLRAALGEELVRGRSSLQLALSPHAWVDLEAADAAIHRAEAAVERERWHEAWAPSHIALNISRRRFLRGLETPWISEQRRHLEEVRLRALECWAAAGLGIGGGELADAEVAAAKLVAESPLRESGYLLLMGVLDARGNRAEAVRVYERLRTTLRDELGLTPGPKARDLHARLLLRGEDQASARR